jgi:DNA-binding transcriptional ArsR family regulator
MLAQGERNAGDIAGRFDMAGPSVSRHLKVLRESGVVSYRQNAQARIYRLEPSALDEARQWMQAQLDVLRERFDRLGAHLDAMKERGD